MKRYQHIYSLCLLLIITAAGCIKKDEIAPAPVADARPLFTILQANYSFTLFISALQRTGYDKLLAGDTMYTLLAPTDQAFANAGISADSLANIDLEQLKTLVGYHILPGAISSDQLPQKVDYPAKSVSGANVFFSVPLPGRYQNQYPMPGSPIIHINGGSVTKADVKAKNGVMHVIDKVLEYPKPTLKALLESLPQYSLYTQALRQFGLLDSLEKPGPFVLMAMPNDIFLQYGLDETALAAIDTVHYKKNLFTCGIMINKFFFKTDFDDAPMPFLGDYLTGGNAPVYFMPDFAMLFNYAIGIVPFNYYEIVNDYGPPYYGNAYIYGDQVLISDTDKDHLAVNGVVHAISGMLVYPDNARIQ